MRSRPAGAAVAMVSALTLVPAAGAQAVASGTGAGAQAAWAGAQAAGAGAGGAASATGTGYWHTRGHQILDASGHPVRIAGINWYGFETPDEVVHGLWSQDYRAIIDDVRRLGYNTIRIPISNQMVEHPIVPQGISSYGSSGRINLDLKGLNSLQILDKIIAYAGRDGLKVILDDHRSEAGESAEQNGLWYTSAYTGRDWIRDWATIAGRYAGDPAVIGFDLRNEPHTPAGESYPQGATWGTGDPATDIRLAYEKAGDAILAADPEALIFCEGVSENPAPAASAGPGTTAASGPGATASAAASGPDTTTWWGGDLAMAGQYPVTLTSPGHVVYSAHDYGPNLFPQTWFSASTTPASLGALWDRNWGYLYTRGIAPVWVGEFGTDGTASDVRSSTPGSQGQWFQSLVSYLGRHRWMGWTYWALNGEDPYHLLDSDYGAVPASAQKQSLLAAIQAPLATEGRIPPAPASASAPAGAGAHRAGRAPASPAAPHTSGAVACSAVYSVVNSWPGGFQAQIVLTSTGTAPFGPWTLTWTFPGRQWITSIWNAAVTQAGERVTANHAPYNATIAPGGSVTIGFTGTGAGRVPTALSVNGRSCS
jgi:endoglucanase